MLGKFLLLVYMAKALTPEEVGIYGLIVASVTWFATFTGLDFHNFALRELISGQKPFRFVVSHLQSVFVLNYGVLLLLCLAAGIHVDWTLISIIFLLTVLEHQGHEASLLAIAVRRPLLSALILFIRSGSWPLVAIFAMALNESLRTIEFVLLSWGLASVSALVVAFFTIYRRTGVAVLAGLDRQWIMAGIKTGLIYWLSSLVLRMTGVLDRYLMEARFGLDMVGVYAFYVSVGLSLAAFVDSAIISFRYPDSVKAVGAGRYHDFSKNQNRMLRNTLLLGLALSCAILLSVPLVLEYMEADLYLRHKDFLFWSLLTYLAYCLSMTPHFGLYSMRKDRVVFLCNASAFAVFLSAFLLFQQAGAKVYSIVYAVAVAYAFLFIVKQNAYRQALREVTAKPHREVAHAGDA